jgi:hypothetical protein
VTIIDAANAMMRRIFGYWPYLFITVSAVGLIYIASFDRAKVHVSAATYMLRQIRFSARRLS